MLKKEWNYVKQLVKLGSYNPTDVDYSKSSDRSIAYYREFDCILLVPGFKYKISTGLINQIVIAVPYRKANGLYSIGFYLRTPIFSILIDHRSKLIMNIEKA